MEQGSAQYNFFPLGPDSMNPNRTLAEPHQNPYWKLTGTLLEANQNLVRTPPESQWNPIGTGIEWELEAEAYSAARACG